MQLGENLNWLKKYNHLVRFLQGEPGHVECKYNLMQTDIKLKYAWCFFWRQLLGSNVVTA